MVVAPFTGKTPRPFRFSVNLVIRGKGTLNDAVLVSRSLYRNRSASFPHLNAAWLANSHRSFGSSGSIAGSKAIASSVASFKCSRCQAWLKPYETLCQSCKAFAPPQLSAGYLKNPWIAFECLESGRLTYDIPLHEVTKEYRSRMVDLHPDRVIGAGGTKEESDLANRHSSMLRFSYEALKNPVTRADLLCQLKYDRQFLKEDANIEDSEFMTDILMAIEYVDELTAENNRQELIEFRKEWNDRLEHQATCLADCFNLLANNLKESKSNEILHQIRNAIHISISIKKLMGMLDNKIIELGIEL